MEYLIRPDDGESFLVFQANDQASVLTPRGWGCAPVRGDGDFRLLMGRSEVMFSLEDPGWQVVVDGPMDGATADRLVAAVARQVALATGVATYWLALG